MMIFSKLFRRRKSSEDEIWCDKRYIIICCKLSKIIEINGEINCKMVQSWVSCKIVLYEIQEMEGVVIGGVEITHQDNYL